eukprot:gene1821-12847_t
MDTVHEIDDVYLLATACRSMADEGGTLTLSSSMEASTNETNPNSGETALTR